MNCYLCKRETKVLLGKTEGKEHNFYCPECTNLEVFN